MKTFTIIIFLALISCSKSNDPKPITDLSGNWTFRGSSFSGDFTLSKSSTGYTLKPGSFTVDGIAHTAQEAAVPSPNQNLLDIYLFALESDGYGYQFYFTGTQASDFKTIQVSVFTYKKFLYSTSQIVVNKTYTESITITRK